jgi:hypothetical protein
VVIEEYQLVKLFAGDDCVKADEQADVLAISWFADDIQSGYLLLPLVQLLHDGVELVPVQLAHN